MNFDDPVARFLGQVILLVILLVLGAISALTLAIAIDFVALTNSQGPANTTLSSLLAFLPALSGTSVKETYNILAILIAAAPLILTAVCFKPTPSKKENAQDTVGTAQQSTKMPSRLNWAGAIAAVLLLVTGLASLVAYLIISSANWAGYPSGSDGGALLQDWSKATLRNAVFYFSALLGMKATS